MGYYYFISLVFLSSYARLGASDYPVDCIPDSYKHGNQIREICGLRNCIYSPNAPSGPIALFLKTMDTQSRANFPGLLVDITSLLTGHWAIIYVALGYTNTESIKAAYDRTIAFKIPLDAQWADIDYMYQFLDFTFDPVNFKGLPDFVDYLHEEGKHFVPIMDPAIDFESKESDGTYKAYALGESMDVWVKRSNGLPMENTSIWWEKCVKDFHQKIKIDGLWIDMNEPSNFVDGDIEEGCPKNQLNEPPYIPRNLQGLKLASKTICPDHTHSLNGELIPHYNLHSLYGLSEARSTIRAVRKVTKTRGFVLSRSTYLSSGRYSAKWLGGQYKFVETFTRVQISVDSTGILLQNFAPDGIKLNKIQEYSVINLHILYVWLSSSTVVRAMWNVFPKDNTSRNIDQQFMWGNGLLIAPVVNEGATQKDVYLPKGSRWYDISYYLQQGLITEVPQKFIGKYISDICSTQHCFFFFIRGGFIFPLQKDDMDTTKSRLNDFMLEKDKVLRDALSSPYLIRQARLVL
ncbi:Alpha-glucosidase [Lepeophtheirus salmonis]|uniref:Alpha-glucosidase n=1 Tax=Lepeophtheirus salmonis TaxID=72036 RepID=A0A7R8CRY2_LEPSM|nr:Alpha-glucosidase [Lepeophtheirus salmonis]CAF2907852.1 Alpha-glucosidase [Lepeophtheirus salmonis]